MHKFSKCLKPTEAEAFLEAFLEAFMRMAAPLHSHPDRKGLCGRSTVPHTRKYGEKARGMQGFA